MRITFASHPNDFKEIEIPDDAIARSNNPIRHVLREVEAALICLPGLKSYAGVYVENLSNMYTAMLDLNFKFKVGDPSRPSI